MSSQIPRALELRWTRETPPPRDFIVTFGPDRKRQRKSLAPSYGDRLAVKYTAVEHLNDVEDVLLQFVNTTTAPSTDPFKSAASRVAFDELISQVTTPFIYSGSRSVVVDGRLIDLISITIPEDGDGDGETPSSETQHLKKRKRPQDGPRVGGGPERLYYYAVDSDVYRSLTDVRDATKAREIVLNQKFEQGVGHLDLPTTSSDGLVPGPDGDFFDDYKDAPAPDSEEQSIDYPSSSASATSEDPIIRDAFRGRKVPEGNQAIESLVQHFEKLGVRADLDDEDDSDDSLPSWQDDDDTY